MTQTPSNKAAQPVNGKFILNVLVKAALLFAVLNLLFALVYPMGFLGRISFYNILFPGRQRLPFGEDQAHAYNLSMYNLDAMFASLHLNGAPRAADEYRVLVVGDLSVWGTLLKPDETLSGQLSAANLTCERQDRARLQPGLPHPLGDQGPDADAGSGAALPARPHHLDGDAGGAAARVAAQLAAAG